MPKAESDYYLLEYSLDRFQAGSRSESNWIGIEFSASVKNLLILSKAHVKPPTPSPQNTSVKLTDVLIELEIIYPSEENS